MVFVAGEPTYFWFPKVGTHKRFHLRQIFTRQLNHKAFIDPIIPFYVGKNERWEEGELSDNIVKEKLGILV